jgi:hemolysin D
MNAIGHHCRVIREALQADKERRRARKPSLEAEFLPAALEVVERPVSPTGRRTAWILLVCLVGTLLWLVLGRVDVVASAPGKIVPSGSVKIVQSAGSGVVRAIYVKDGDIVRQGQLLVELDPTLSSADLEEAQKGLLAAELDAARNRAIADALAGRDVHFVAPDGTAPDVAETQRQLIAAQVGEVEANVSSLSAARASSLSDAAAAAAQRRKLDSTLPILDHELEAMNRLDAKGYAPGLRLLELQRQRRGEAGDRDVAAAQEAKGFSDAQKLARQMSETREQALRIALADLAKAESEVILRREEVTKAQRKSILQRLTAPADGTVQQLAIHTIGGVVEPARPLMVIVPLQDGLEVEAHVLNKDAGFVHDGQKVAVKIEAFPFTRYGSAPGVVESLSRDAVPDQKLGATYTARIRLTRPYMMIDGQRVGLTSGLSVTADIRTGSRRIISWLLSPVQTSVAQAGRER